MDSQIQIHKPMCRITMDDGEVFYLPTEQRQQFEMMASKNPFSFFNLEGVTRKYKDIKKIVTHKSMGYEDLPKHLRTKVEGMIQKYQETFAEYPSENQIQKYIKVVTQNY